MAAHGGVEQGVIEHGGSGSRITLVAPEFPPAVGGMERLAQGLATALAENDGVDRLWVATTPESAGERGSEAPENFERLPLWSGSYETIGSALRAHAERQRVDHFLGLNAATAPLADLTRTPFSVSVNGNDLLEPWWPCGPRWLEAVSRPYFGALRHALRRRAIERALERSVDKVLVISSGTGSLVERAAPRARPILVPPGVDDRFFQERRQPGERSDGQPGLRLLTVTRLSSSTRRKNVDGLLHAIARVDRRWQATLEVVGDGDDRPRLEALAKELGLLSGSPGASPRVRFRGGVSAEDLLVAYREADLFLLASKATSRDVEGFGIVYLEASAAGVPVICSRAGGAIDAVVPGENGWIAEDSEPETLARLIERFAREPGVFDSARVRAVAERYRWPAVAERCLTALRSL